MKWVSTIVLALMAVLVLAAGARSAVSRQDKIAPRVNQLLRSQGTVPVFVRLNLPVTTKVRLTVEQERAQSKTFRAAQDLVLEQLAGISYKLRHRFDLVPTLSMDVGVAALAVLERSPQVAKVYEVTRLSSPW